jgi:hypothetical protein
MVFSGYFGDNITCGRHIFVSDDTVEEIVAAQSLQGQCDVRQRSVNTYPETCASLLYKGWSERD